MAPILIDSRDVLKLGFISMLVMILSFTGGFLFGHQRATVFYQTGSDIQSLSLPDQLFTREGIVDSQGPSIIEAGEEIDVDQPEIKMQATNSSSNVMAAPVETSAVVTVTTSENKEIPAIQKNTVTTITEVSKVEQLTESNENNLEVKIQSTKSVKNKDDRSTKDNSSSANESISSAEASIITAFTSDELKKIKYSIQVGMYGRLMNAENMMKMLQAQQFDAYVTDYTNRKNEIRYNVRFGYFSDKKSAIASLDRFKTSQKGDGYLVKFSADNIVKVADATNIEQAVDAPAQAIDTGKDLTPVIAPSGTAQDKLSQADVLNDMITSTSLSKTN